MATRARSIKGLKVRNEKPESVAELEEHRVLSVSKPLLELEEGGGKLKTIELPEVRIIEIDDSQGKSTRPYGPDRARAWKIASEWIQELVIDQHPAVQEKRYEDRLKAEESYFHNKEAPDLYKWQEDDELLKEIRPRYRKVKDELVDRIGKPSRSDFDRLFPHQYDDPGLSERARRSVRDLKGVFGKDIVVKK